MEKTGEKLKKARLVKGLSLEEAHKRTKIHLNILKALEEDSIISLNPVYRRGFLKIYCDFLGISVSDVMSPHDDKAQPQAPKKEPAPQFKQPRLSANLKSEFFRRLDLFKPYINLRNIFRIVLILLALVVLSRLPRVFSGIKKSLADRRHAAPGARLAEPVMTGRKNIAAQESRGTAPETVNPAPVSQPQAPKIKPAVLAEGIRLGLRARADSWAQVKVDGRTVFQGMLKKNRPETWRADEKIELSLGDAGVVDLEVNGKLISRLARRKQALKNILITKEGLRVIK